MKLLYSFLKDMKLSLQSFYIYIELGFALIFVAILVFVVPKQFESNMTVYASVQAPAPVQTMVEEALSRAQGNVTLVNGRAEVVAALEQNRSAVGLVVSQQNGRPVFDYVLQGYENQRLRNILRTAMEAQFASRLPGYRNVTSVVTLDQGAEKLPDRVNILPVFLALNAAFMGLFIIASYVFLDKDEGTIRAFAVTPAKVWHYLAGKLGVMLISGLMSGLVATVFVAGARAHYFHLIMLLIATNAFGSALGLFIASFFDSMAKAMGWLYASIIVLSFAAVSYYLPAFSPLAIRILPSYPMLFAFRETLLRQIDLTYVYMNVVGFGVAGVVLFFFANLRFKRTLTV